MPAARRERFVPVYICPHEGCERGQKNFLKKNNLYQHYLIHVDCIAMCNACDTSFTGLSALVRHAKSCGDDFFNSSPRDAKIMVDLIVSCRRMLEEHVRERIKARRVKYASDRAIEKKSLLLNSDHSEGQTSHGVGALLFPEASPGRMSDIETNISEGIQQSRDDQNGPPSAESTKMPNHQPHRWIPDLTISELDGTGRSAPKVHLFEDFTCPHGECSNRKKDWRNRGKLLKHYYSHFSCAAMCNTCNRDICSLDSLVVHIDWCKGFLSSSPRAATIRAELMKACEKLLDKKLAKRFTAGLTVGEQEACNENSKAQLKYLMSCTMNPKLPFPDLNLSGLQVLPDTNIYYPSQNPPAFILGAKANATEGFQQSHNGDLELPPKEDANSALRLNYDELPKLQQSPSRHHFDAQVTVPPVQRGEQQPLSPKTQQLARDVSLVAQYPTVTSLDIHEALPVEILGLSRASFDPIVNMDPSFHSQWSTELCEPLPADMSGLSRARVDPATNIDPNLCMQLLNNVWEAAPANISGMNQDQLDPNINLDLNPSFPSAVSMDHSMCLPSALDVNKALIANQIDPSGALFDSSILMAPTFCLPLSTPTGCNECSLQAPHAPTLCLPLSTPTGCNECSLQAPQAVTLCLPLSTPTGCNECSLQALQARPFVPTAPMLDFSLPHNHVYSGGGENGVFTENSCLGWN